MENFSKERKIKVHTIKNMNKVKAILREKNHIDIGTRKKLK